MASVEGGVTDDDRCRETDSVVAPVVSEEDTSWPTEALDCTAVDSAGSEVAGIADVATVGREDGVAWRWMSESAAEMGAGVGAACSEDDRWIAAAP